MHLEITPQPSDQERAAIEAALEQEPHQQMASVWRASPWADLLLPQRDDDPEP
jgi:hypothetical protein